ncbi:MAG: hypothetical protein KGJ13_05510 [Patescibacteria group bacterium]|nr:hypothetical protein [Patescibacteria group bacterium]
MRKFKFAFLTAAVALAIGPAAFASTLAVETLPTQTYLGYYVGPAGGLLDGQPVQLVCDDFKHITYVPSGNLGVAISIFPTLTSVRFTAAPMLQNYEQAAMLAYEMQQPGNSGQIGDIQFAIWNIFNPATPDTAGSDTWLAWLASQDRSAWNYSEMKVVTPGSGFSSNQEFLVGTPTPTPEPLPFVLVGCALAGIGRIRRRRL